MGKGKGKNFLEFIPIKKEGMQWDKRDDGNVQLIILRDSLLDKIVRKFFKTPEKTIIDLDELGSFVWENIDGEKNVHEITINIENEFGEKAEPVRDRLITYIKILKNNNFIDLKE
ncbi:PqqD family protein [Clostridiisalibacter paucivorans]|uniref:PqqD family protein n=1 Tax=Clostridiisalibacter paucivorans TaxID=408753 RepID=UPI0005586159|nr:PqqD family protein [Clostridiisalibacter paucivorans]